MCSCFKPLLLEVLLGLGTTSYSSPFDTLITGPVPADKLQSDLLRTNHLQTLHFSYKGNAALPISKYIYVVCMYVGIQVKLRFNFDKCVNMFLCNSMRKFKLEIQKTSEISKGLRIINWK